MFGNKKGDQMGSNTEKHVTLIADNTSITGDISAEGNVRIDGNYKGDIASNGEVVIGENGFVKGNIVADSVSISGKVEGNIQCRGLLEIYSHGVVEGDIEVSSISIVEGGIHNGMSSMGNKIKSGELDKSTLIEESDIIDIIED